MNEVKAGDEVIHKHDETLDLLTVLEVNTKTGMATCFEYNPKHSFSIPIEDLEVMSWSNKV